MNVPPYEYLSSLAQEQRLAHQAACAWREMLAHPIQVVWLPRGDRVGRSTYSETLPTLPRRIRNRIARLSDPYCASATDRISEYVALRLALGEEANYYTYTHSALGQPRLQRRAGVTAPPSPRISFTHDGEAHITVLTRDPSVKGIGVDVVYLPRLHRGSHAQSHLRRFARRFMCDDEYDAITAIPQHDDHALLQAVAARFSLMEAASKALGTGLRLGMGYNRPKALAPQSICVRAVSPNVHIDLRNEALRRLKWLKTSRIEGFWGQDAEYLVSVALLY